MSEHAILSISASGRWGNCPGSVQMEFAFDDGESTVESEEGDAAHWVASEILQSFSLNSGGIKTSVDFLNKMAPNGVIVTSEMIENVEIYTDSILKTCSDKNMGITRQVETKVYPTAIHETQCWGTVDCRAYDDKEKTLYIWDFKYGHKYVDEYENNQLIGYAQGYLEELGVNGLADQFTYIVMTIVQPRYYHGDKVRSWKIKASDLRGYVNKLHHSGHEALGANATCRSGTHCTNCKAMFHCEANRRAVMSGIDYVLNVGGSKVDGNDSGQELLLLERISSMIDDRKDAVEQQVYYTLKSGKPVKNYALKPKSSRLKWNSELSEESIINIGLLFGLDISKKTVITPTQAIKLGVPEDNVNKIASRTSSMVVSKIETKDAEKAFK